MQKGSHEEMAQERKCQVIKIENVTVSGWEAAIRGMRNPMNSWSQSDSHVLPLDCDFTLFGGDNG